ncbi:hypothetical protein O3W44_21335 [Pantoea sp. LMR881]|nr:hypothetical protein [Pantoea sp. LMR881]MCZ4061090.1 hypothetical protein [Pantoea sp. LMR881]
MAIKTMAQANTVWRSCGFESDFAAQATTGKEVHAFSPQCK